MFNSSFSKDWLSAVRQLSPSMLLLSLTLHGLLLLMPLSSFTGRKIPYSKTTPKQEQIFVSQSKSSQFFSDDKALVKQKDLTSTPIPTIDPQFTSQLPSLPQDAPTQTQLPIPEIEATPTLPLPEALPEVTPTVAPANPDVSFASFKEAQQVTDGTAAVVVAPKTASPKKQNATPKVPVKAKTVTPVTSPTQEPPKPVPTKLAPIKESIPPEALPSSQEKETFDGVLNKLNQELSLSEEVNSQPEKFSSAIEIERIYGTVIDKTPEEVAANVISKLELQSFKVSQLNNYAGGLVYTVTKNKFTQYITFTANTDKTGTVIIIWRNL
ncbi:hypothetical protein [Dulcicalothrix desertica]|nr:hypothetical protein [Dulcicalothrix desertica]TWH39626.1 hypothetical protein CAL7102_08875 [Dulcicalothrix desertica PCC 7102]